jgi:hypothetical protein
MKKTVRNAMPTIEEVQFVSREKPGPHPFSKYSFSNITEKIGHITCSQPVDWTNSRSFPFRGCKITKCKGLSLNFIRLDSLSKGQNRKWQLSTVQTLSLFRLQWLVYTGSRPIWGPKISQ